VRDHFGQICAASNQIAVGRDTALEILRSRRAHTSNAIIARAVAVSEKTLSEDYDRHGKIAVSFAADVLRYFSARVA
jgi:hypothetical protein